MAFTYPPGGFTFASLNDVNVTGLVVNDTLRWNGTDWVVDDSRPGTLLSPQKVETDGGINVYTPLVTVNDSGYDLSAPSALPISFDKDTKITGVLFTYSSNLNKIGQKPWGEYVANPGWQYRMAIYNSDPVTGLPTTLRYDNSTVVTIPAADESGGAASGQVGWNSLTHVVPANTPVWITIISVPKVWPNWANGFKEQDTYLYDAGTSTFIQSNAANAGRIKAATGQGFFNNLLPISTLPIAPQSIFVFNNQPRRNALGFFGVNPFDYSSFGGPVASNISTFTFPSNWPSRSFEWPPSSGTYHQYAHVTQQPGFMPMIVGQLN
jgi:hypothetical protein